MMLLQAAADQWTVPVSEVTVSNGVIIHAASKRSTTYGKVAAAAASLEAPDPKSITLKDPKDWKLAGKPLKRLDTAAKLNGSLVDAIDVTLPGMLHAAIKACPVFGGTLVSYDEAKIAALPGVRRAVKVNDTTVAVVADTWWRAKRALDALPIVWNEGAGASQSSAMIAEHLKEGLTAAVTNGSRQNGDAAKTELEPVEGTTNCCITVLTGAVGDRRGQALLQLLGDRRARLRGAGAFVPDDRQRGERPFRLHHVSATTATSCRSP